MLSSFVHSVGFETSFEAEEMNERILRALRWMVEAQDTGSAEEQYEAWKNARDVLEIFDGQPMDGTR